MVSVPDKVVFFHSPTILHEEEKPRHIYRIRKTDYVKLPPIKPGIVTECCPKNDDVVDEYMIDIERYVKDLMPNVDCYPTKLRKTNKSPKADQADLSLWPHSNKYLHKKRFAYNLPRGYFSKAKLEEIPDFNRDMLEKEVEIKRILESHRPTLLRSLRDLRGGKNADMSGDKLEVAGFGGGDADTESIKSISIRSTISDSAFGEWEGTREDTDDYLPSGRTLVTDEQERSTILHTLDEQKSLKEYAPSEESDNAAAPLPTPSPPPSPVEEPIQPPVVQKKTPSRTPKSRDRVRPTPKPPTPKAPTPPPPVEEVPVEEEEEVAEDPPPAPVSPLIDLTELMEEDAKENEVIQQPEPHAEPVPEPEPVKKPEPKPTPEPEPVPVQEPIQVPEQVKPIEAKTESNVDTPVVKPGWESEDILGINAMLADTDDEGEKEKEAKIPESPDQQSETTNESPESETITPPQVYVYKPPPKEPTPTPTPTPPTPTPTPPPPPPTKPATPPTVRPPLAKKRLPPPPRKKGLSSFEEEAMRDRMEAMMDKSRAQQKSREKEQEMQVEPESESDQELQGDEDVSEILERFTIVDRGRLNYLQKIFSGYLPSEHDIYLSHQEMKKALSQIKSCTKISRNQLKFIELILGLSKNKISFHTFAVMATLIDHMSHKDPETLAMFDSIDITRMKHDLPRLKRLFHCVSQRDDFGWPKLTTEAMDIELRAACVAEKTRNNLIRQLDPDNRGEISIFDFIIYTPFWIYLHDGIVDNPFNEIERDVVSPVHRKWGVSVLWLPEQSANAREPPATPASGCGSELSTPDLYLEPQNMRAVQGGDYSESEENEDTIVNSDEDD